MQSSFAFSSDGRQWWLVNASPDVAQQIEAAPPLQPRDGRGTPLRGMFLTDANVDHLGGLAVLRQAGDHAFTVYSSDTTRALAMSERAFVPFGNAPHRWQILTAGTTVGLDERLQVHTLFVPGLTPGYAGRRSIAGAVAAYTVEDRVAGKRVVFAPVFAAVDESLRAAIAQAQVAFVDGSFWSDAELATVGVAKTARDLGHCPVGEPGGSLRILAPHASGTRLYYSHLNNTNPLLDPDSEAARQTAGAGFSIAYDGLVLDI